MIVDVVLVEHVGVVVVVVVVEDQCLSLYWTVELLWLCCVYAVSHASLHGCVSASSLQRKKFWYDYMIMVVGV